MTTNYNAEIEAMRNGKLEDAKFGPLGYVLAHEVAKAEVVAGYANKDSQLETYWASIVTWPGSGIKTVAGHQGQELRLFRSELDLGPSPAGLRFPQGRDRSR